MTISVNGRRVGLTSSVSFFVLACMAGGAEAQTTNCENGRTPTAERPCGPGDLLPANAAPTEATEGDVVVTGSRIAHRGTETASPLQTITSKDLDARGYQTVAQALNELPSFGVPGASPVGFNQSGFGAGQSFVDFLGLGSQRTLTLVNGRRFVSGNTSSIFGPTGSGGNQVDLNVIPTKLIDRVETVAAIGAPIYGSDAIAGTINIILKKNFEGVDLDAQTGISTRGDAPDNRIRLLAGKNFAGGRGNITISGEFDQSKGLFFNDRAQTASDNRFAASPTGGPRIIYADNRIPSVSPYGIPLVGGANVGFDLTLTPQQSNVFFGDPTLNFGVNNAAGTQLKFDQQGNLIPIIYGSTIGSPNGFSVFTSGGNGFTLRDVENLLTDVKRYSGNIEASFDLTPDIRLFGEGWYSVSEGRNLASQPVYNSGLFGAAGSRDGNLIISINNPFLSPAARAAILNDINNNPLSDQNNPFGDPALNGITQNYFYLGRANVDLSSGVSTGKSQILRFVGGMDGTLHVLPGRDWKFEAYANYGRSLVTSRNPELNEQNFRNAINAVNGSGGSIVCAPGFTNSPIATLSSTCAPINPFGNQISQAAKDYITTIATPRNVNNQYDGVVSVSGPLFKLPGGNFAFALGYEHRAEDATFDPGQFYFGSGTGNSSQRGSYGRSVPIDPVFGKYHTDEIFGELNAELIGHDNDVPFIYELSLQTAGRYIWNSQAGGDPTYTFQGRYAPVRDIAFRAAYTRAVRAPSITEAFNPTSSAFGFATDVCDASLRNSGPDPVTRAKNCAAAGVPTNFASLSNDRSFQTFTFGNPSLKNEKSDNITVGMVLTPRFLPGFSATVDYVNITLNNAISQFSNDQVVAACYDATNYPNNPFCALITRDFSGAPGSSGYAQLSNVGTSYFNSAKLKYKGILAEISYRTASDFLGKGSHVGFDVNYQYLDTLSTVVTAGSAPVLTSNSVGYSRHKGVATFRYDNGGFFGQLQVNYIGKTRVDPNTAFNFYAVPEVKAFTYVNLSLRQDIAKHFSINVDIDNLFDVKAPYPYPASGGTTTYFQGILGRYIRFGAAVHF
jgi:outer membrane receptor protein involved in Fe transport